MFCTTTPIMFPLNCHHSRNIIDTILCTEGFHCSSDASRMSKLDWSLLRKLNASSLNPSRQAKSQWNKNLTKVSTAHHNRKWKSKSNQTARKSYNKAEKQIGSLMPGTLLYSSTISMSAYKAALPLAMRGVHLVFHVYVLRMRTPDLIGDQRLQVPEHVEVNSKEEGKFQDILHHQRQDKNLRYCVTWK